MYFLQIKDTISSLNLEDNGIGPGEMLHLGQMLLQGSSIQELVREHRANSLVIAFQSIHSNDLQIKLLSTLVIT